MVYVVSRQWFPTHKAEEVTEIFQKINKEEVPQPVGEVVVFAGKGSRKGIVGMTFLKVTQENIAQGMQNAITRLQNYNKVEGYEWNVEVWADVTEAAQ